MRRCPDPKGQEAEMFRLIALCSWWVLVLGPWVAFAESVSIRGGTVVTVEGAVRADVRILGEKIVEVELPQPLHV